MYKNRLREIRKQTGMTIEAAAVRIGTTKDMLSKLERGERKITEDWIKKLSDLYRVGPSKLLSNEGAHSPILGYVGAGGHVFPVDDLPLIYPGGFSENIQPDDPIEWVDTPYGLSNVAALRVKGDSMYPMLKDGWLVFYCARAVSDFDAHLGETVIVWCKDGSVMVKTLRRGTSRGRYNLESFNAPMIEDAEIQYAARIESITPRRK